MVGMKRLSAFSVVFTKVVAPQLDTYLTNILSQRGWASRLELKTLREEPERNM